MSSIPHEICLLDQFPIQLDWNEHLLFLFDIDGVVCNTNMHYTDESKLSVDEYKKLMQERVCSPLFIKTAHVLLQFQHDFGTKFEIKFLTGRKPFVKQETEKMFQDAGLDAFINDIIYYPEELAWATEEYLEFKVMTVANFYIQYDHIYYIDDNERLIQTMTENLRHLPRIHIFFYYGNGDGCIKKTKKTDSHAKKIRP